VHVDPQKAQRDAFVADWLREFGPRMSGERLWKALGFKSRRPFERAAREGRLIVTLYPFSEGRGRYAKTIDVARQVWSELVSRKKGDLK
jgi:hypothetical protein